MSQVNIHLTGPEAKHMLTLLYERRDEGSYYGHRDQYYARTKRLIEKVSAAILAHDGFAPESQGATPTEERDDG